MTIFLKEKYHICVETVYVTLCAYYAGNKMICHVQQLAARQGDDDDAAPAPAPSWSAVLPLGSCRLPLQSVTVSAKRCMCAVLWQ